MANFSAENISPDFVSFPQKEAPLLLLPGFFFYAILILENFFKKTLTIHWVYTLK